MRTAELAGEESRAGLPKGGSGAGGKELALPRSGCPTGGAPRPAGARGVRRDQVLPTHRP